MVFCVNASTIGTTEIAQSASHFIANILQISNTVPILIMCTHSDSAVALDVDNIQLIMEREMTFVRDARMAALSDINDDDKGTVAIDDGTFGDVNQKFKFKNLRNPVEFTYVSLLTADSDELMATVLSSIN